MERGSNGRRIDEYLSGHDIRTLRGTLRYPQDTLRYVALEPVRQIPYPIEIA